MLPRLTVLLSVCLLAAAGRGQDADGLLVHHSFPEAGTTLGVVVEGLQPLAMVGVRLAAADAAPPSVRAHLEALDAVRLEDALVGAVQADGMGIVSLAIPLRHAGDGGALLRLRFRELSTGRETGLRLAVQPPMLLVPTGRDVQRIDLRDGSVLQPPLPGGGVLRGAALSASGLTGYLLRGAGRLDAVSTLDWSASPRRRERLDADGDDLAWSPASGPSFVIVRPRGGAFAPSGRLLLLEEDGVGAAVAVPSLVEEVAHRRWAVSDDGLTAYLAGDDLVVSEVDLVSGTSRPLLAAGLPGDREVTDVSLVGGRLMVLSRRTDGLPGSLSVYDTGTGWMTPHGLDLDPARLVGLDGGVALVVPGDGAAGQVVRDGVPVEALALAPGAELVDAAPVGWGAVLLVRDEDGVSRLLLWDRDRGLLPMFLDGPVPRARRIVTGGGMLGVLLGTPDGRVHRVDLLTGRLGVIAGVETAPDAGDFLVLP